MKLYKIMMQLDDAWDTINEMGKSDCVHFVDLNKNSLTHEMKYAKTIKKIDDIERSIEYFGFSLTD